MSQRPARSIRTRALLTVIVAVVAGLVPIGIAQGSEGGPKLTVMTRNLYLGTGLTNTVTATSFPELIGAVTQDWANVVATNFPKRAGALADEIGRARPDVVGLEEVSLWRDQTPSDIVSSTGTLIGAPTPNATHVVYDFLAILQRHLAARGMPYTAVSTSTNADVEATRANGPPGTGFTDVRLTDRDVILVRTPLARSFRNAAHGLYASQLTAPSIAGPVTFTRGWASIDYRHDARMTVRIFVTHLEVETPIQAAQVQELQGTEFLGQVAASPYPVIALGDFNSAADGSTTTTYAMLTHVLTDAWVTAHGSHPGLSCCQNELLNNPTSIATSRIDLVLTTRNWPADRVALTGNTPFEKAAPFWASDHFGVTARLEIQR